MKLSIVVPVCNVEKYLSECLDSVIRQKRVDEIICVNDGSTDHSLNIIREFEKKDSRIKVIDKPNSGYGDSVNQGIELASGDYVGILESDDMVVDGIYSEMMEIAEATNVDIIKGNYNTFETTSKSIVYQNNMRLFEYNKIISFKDNRTIFFVSASIWSAIYKKSFLLKENIKLLQTPSASYQDSSFVFKTWVASNSIYLIDKPVVNYRYDSIGSSSNTDKKTFAIFNETEEMQKFLMERNLESLYPEFVRLKFASYIWTLNRLNENGRLKFLFRLIPELRDDFYKGYLCKIFWDDFNWNLVHTLLFDWKKAMEYFNSDDDILKENYDLVPALTKISPLYIYGAGKFGLKKLNELREKGLNVTAFVVSDIVNNPANIEGIPVISLNRIDKDGVIVLGISERFKGDVLKVLKDNWLLNNILEV